MDLFLEEDMEIIKIDIGGGNKPKEGYVNIDLVTGTNLEKDKLPFESSPHFLQIICRMLPGPDRTFKIYFAVNARKFFCQFIKQGSVL